MLTLLMKDMCIFLEEFTNVCGLLGDFCFMILKKNSNHNFNVKSIKRFIQK